MVTGVLIPALNHIRKNQDKCILHLTDKLVLFLNIHEVLQILIRHLREGIIQIFRLISGENMQFVEHLSCLF